FKWWSVVASAIVEIPTITAAQTSVFRPTFIIFTGVSLIVSGPMHARSLSPSNDPANHRESNAGNNGNRCERAQRDHPDFVFRFRPSWTPSIVRETKRGISNGSSPIAESLKMPQGALREAPAGPL